MKNLISILTIILIFNLTGCTPSTDSKSAIKELQLHFESGNLSKVMQTSDSIKKHSQGNNEVTRFADSLRQISERIILDFPVSEEQITDQLGNKISGFNEEQKSIYEKKGWLEWRLINGEKMYFNRAASNLLLLKSFYEQRENRTRAIAEDPRMKFRLQHTKQIVDESLNKSNPVVPVKMKITYTITVNPDAVPAGEIIRCWLPWPKETNQRQKLMEIISTSQPDFLISPDTAIHTSLYMEKISVKNTSATFQVVYMYESWGQFFNLGEIKQLPYDTNSLIYKKYTKPELPQIHFQQNIRNLADSLTTPGDSPAIIVSKIYSWFKQNIPWTGALEYSIMPDIPEYVSKNKRGDCGMQTFLFISMLRYKGIPVKWQSGWMVPPSAENLHDWCEVYFEGTGWVPVDVSYDLQDSEIQSVKEFYLSGIDSYRLIVNEGISGQFYPPKKFMRSEPYDFQRGELEWSGGNLYFDKWDYDMKIEYIK